MASDSHTGQHRYGTCPSLQKVLLDNTGLRASDILCSFSFTQYTHRNFFPVVFFSNTSKRVFPMKGRAVHRMERVSH